MNTLERIKNIIITPKKTYGARLIDIIQEHNHSVENLIDKLGMATLVQILISKGIISEEEYNSTIEMLSETTQMKTSFDILENNHAAIVELIQETEEMNDRMKNAYENMSDSEDIDIDSNIINEIFDA